MAYSYVRYSGNGSTTNYTFSFPTISTDHIKVRVNGTLVTNWSFLNSSTIQFAAAPASGAVIEIRRETPKDSTIVNFTDGSVLLERDLDLLATWQLYLGQETEDDIEDTIRVDSQSRFDAQNRRIINVADPINAQDAVTKVYADAVIGQATAAASAAAAVQVALAADEAIDSAASALAAASSASSAGTSAISAASSATSAAASYDSFDDRYLGDKAVAPTVDNDGNSLLVGACYWDTGSQQMFTWAGSQWKPTFLTGNTVRSLVTATAGQTVVTTPTYIVGGNTLQVYVNGVKFVLGSDYTETTQNSITFIYGLTAGDEVEMVAVQAYSIGTTGAESVSFQHSGTGASLRTVAAELKESASIKGFGGVGDGSTSDQAAVANALAAGFKSIRVNDNHDFLVSSLSNTKGIDLDGGGNIVKAITGGLQKLNSYADKHKYVFGQEYMAAFHNFIMSPSRTPIVVCSGDSTTAGDGTTTGYRINELIKTAAYTTGLQTKYGISSLNYGRSGKKSSDWISTYLAEDLAANPDLLVLRWGINDGLTQDVNAFIANLRSGLATIRASRSVSSLSILLMSPNSTSDTPNHRDEMWYEQIVPAIKQAARDYFCTFIDTYGYLRDARPAAGVWMDNPYGDGRAIHPLNVMNLWIAGVIQSVLFPDGLQSGFGKANIRNTSGSEDTGNGNRLPSYYPYGISISRALTNFPLNGAALTVRHADELVLQINSSYLNAEVNTAAIRCGRSATLDGAGEGWGAWMYIGGGTSAVTAATGWTNPGAGGMRAASSGKTINIDGYLSMNTPATLTANTVIGYVSTGYRPTVDSFYGVCTVWNGSTFANYPCRVAPSDGGIIVLTATTIAATRVWLNVSYSTAT